MQATTAGTPPPAVGATEAIQLVREPIEAARLLAAVADTAAGANVLFTGTTRGVTDGVVTRRLDYEAHDSLARAVLARLRAEAMAIFGLTACTVAHRVGVVPVGETSVAVATSAPHRREAFAAAEWLMERIKTEAPIWKCEEAADGTRDWVHPDAVTARPSGGGTGAVGSRGERGPS
jgi:molybdopterin synthase catalytic subunit